MPLIELQFPNNTGAIPSLQVGDIAFYASGTNISDTGGFNNFSLSEQNLVTIGTITSVSTTSGTIEIICNISSHTTPPTTTDFNLIAKDNTENLSVLVGYFGTAKFINDSTEKAELFATSCEITESSK